MIVEFLIGLIGGLIQGLMAFIPAISVDLSGFSGSGASIGAVAGWMDGYFPVLTLFLCIGIRYAVWLGITMWRLARMTWDLVPFKAT